MATPIKNPTIWRPGNGQGSVVLVGFLPIVDSATKLPIVENSTKLPIVTNQSITKPKSPTMWTPVG